MNIGRFNSQSLSDTQIKLLSTGRGSLVDTIASSLLEGAGVRQHVLITGPRGFGKSFLLRAVKVAIDGRDEAVKVIILPEEQLNITTPSGLLREITRNLAGLPPSTLAGQFHDDEEGAWDAARAELNRELDKLKRDELVIVGLENFDELVERVFDDPAEQSSLRKFLSESTKIGILATALSAEVDQDYEQRLFNAFATRQLKPWSDDDHFLYFERRAILEGKDPSHLDHGRIQALAQFTGGAPRMAVALADLLLEGDPLSAAQMLDKFVDELTPYYQNILDRMPLRTRTLFDALIRQSEPCSQSELAERVGTSQNRIAQHFAWLRERHLVTGRKRQGGRDYLYRVSDRLFVQYYRKRYLYQEDYTPLSGMAELLDGFFTATENNAQAMSLFENGKTDEACEFIRASMRSVKGELGSWSQKSNNAAAMRAFGESRNGNYEDAILHFQKAVIVAERERDAIGQAVLLGQQGLCHSKLNQVAEAIEAHQTALSIWRRLEREDGQAWVLNQLAQGFRHARQYRNALHHAELALELWKTQGLEDRVASTLGEIGENLRRMGRTKDALNAYFNAVEIWGEVGNNAAIGWVYGGIGLTKRQQNDFRESITYHSKATKLLKRFKTKKPNLAYNLNWAAVSYRHLYEFDAALACDRQALEIWNEIDNNRSRSMTLSSIVLNYMGMEDFRMALEIAIQALSSAREGNFQSQIVHTASQISHLLLKEGDSKQMWQFLDSSGVHDRSWFYEAVLTKSGAGLSEFRKGHGRAEAFRLGMDVIEGLIKRDNRYPASQSIMFFLVGLLASDRSYTLVQDLVAEADALEAGLLPSQTLAISIAAQLLDQGPDDPVVEKMDPDISSAVRAILSSITNQRRELRLDSERKK